MISALKLSALGAALALLGSAALAGSAPAAYYPSLGYGQSDGDYEVAPGGYVDEPAYADSYGPPPGYAGAQAHGPHGPCCGGPRPAPGPPVVYGEREHSYAERGFSGEHVYGEVRRDEFNYDSGWRVRRIPLPAGDCRCGRVEHERFAASERIPDSFFADTGGVGPDEFYGGGGGGGGVVIGGGGGASAGSFAFASASARASASVGIRIGRHGGGGHGGGHMSHGCGCKK